MVLSLGLALGGLYWVQRRFPHPVREANNEVAGFFLAVLGVIYAVLLAFVVLTVWEDFEDARKAVEQEANEVVILYRLGRALPDPVGGAVREGTRQYAELLISDEWPLLARGDRSPRAQAMEDALWAAVVDFQAATDHDRILQDQSISSLHGLDGNRHLRMLASQTGLPPVMWVLLIGGAVITIVFTYFFCTPNPAAQYAMTALYTASIVFVLVLIRLLDFPFSGDFKVGPEAFELALQIMQRLSGA
jgi:hypothetical protein